MPFDGQPPAETTARDHIIQVRDLIAEMNPVRFDMADWGRNTLLFNAVSPHEMVHNCFTAACIGGWCDALRMPDVRVLPAQRDEAATAAWLGLTADDGNALFYMTRTDEHFDNVTPSHAVAVLDILLETGEVDWDAAFTRVELSR